MVSWVIYCIIQLGSYISSRLIALMMQAVGTSKTLVNVYQTTRRNIPEDNHFQSSAYLNVSFVPNVFYCRQFYWGQCCDSVSSSFCKWATIGWYRPVASSAQKLVERKIPLPFYFPCLNEAMSHASVPRYCKRLYWMPSHGITVSTAQKTRSAPQRLLDACGAVTAHTSTDAENTWL
jgi:hypothetical protein